LANSQFFYGIHRVFARWCDIVFESQEFVNCIFSQLLILLADYVGPKINSGLKVQILFDKSSKIPDCNEFVNKLRLRERQTHENFNRKLTETRINLIMSEKKACIIFPDRHGVVDLHGNFISSDPEFVSWGREFFEFKWNN
jgi:predicted transcriptional regulator